MIKGNDLRRRSIKLIRSFFAVVAMAAVTVVLLAVAVEAVNYVYPLERPERLKDTFQNKWISGFNWLNGYTRLYQYRDVPGATS